METSKPSADPGLAARRAALDLMDAVLGEGRILADAAPKAKDLAPADLARAGRLANQTFRFQQRCDRVLGRFLRQLPPPSVMLPLRLATYELLAAGEAPHGVVSSAVSLVRERSGEDGLARLTNAVLRKVSTSGLSWDDLAVPELPKVLRKPLMAAYGGARLRAIEAVHAMVPPVDLTVKTAPDVEGELLPTGSFRLATQGQISALPGYETGEWWVQDAAAAVPVGLFRDLAGKRALDMCAAPGGKTMQLAHAGAEVTALDVAEARLKTVAENLARTGLRAKLVEADSLKWEADAPFDAVLLDAPCSATGTIRRNPDLPFAKAELELEGLLRVQARLIDKALAHVKQGGQIIFCTCSLLPDEGEAQIEAALARHDTLALDPIGAGDHPGLAPDWLVEGALRITPESWAERGGIDGFYIARLTRTA